MEARERRVGPYRLLEPIGGGGMGVVWRAVDDAGNAVAVKTLRATIVGDESRKRFERESTISIEHPNIVRTLSTGIDDEGTPWIAFELVEGETLDARLTNGTLDVQSVERIGIQLCNALDAIHQRGIVHRDVKPANIMLTGKGAYVSLKLLDFGIAAYGGDRTRFTGTGRVVGTPAYLSPEQATGTATLDPRSDVWAVGVVLYEALTGVTPFEREAQLATMLAVVMEEAQPLLSRAPHVPVSLGAAIDKCLSKEPAKRHASALALGAAIADAVQGVDLASAEFAITTSVSTETTLDAITSTITPGEERVVSVILASGIRDARLLESTVREAGGSVVRLAGEQLLGLFGGVRWEGNEIERAARAALAMRGGAEHVSVASGKASFHSITGVSGAVLRSAESTAATVLHGVALDTATYQALGPEFNVRIAGPHVYELESITRQPAPRTRTALPILGRALELSHLQMVFTDVAERKRARSAVVLGAVGAGKTRLVTAFRDHVEQQGARVVYARATPERREASYGLFAQFVPGVGEALAVPGDSRTSSPGSSDGTNIQLLLDRARIAVHTWLDHELRICESAGNVLTLVCEDVQWTDDHSWELLRELTSLAEERPLLVVASSRVDQLDESRARNLLPNASRAELGGLSSGDVALLSTQVSGVQFARPFIERLTNHTGGNPLFIEQIIASLRATSNADGSALDIQGDFPLPLTVEAAVQSRLDHLNPIEKEICKHASLFFDRFTVTDLEALGAKNALPTANALASVGVFSRRLEEGGLFSYTIRSRVVAEVAYNMTPENRRRELHAVIARHLRSRSAPMIDSARHWDRAANATEAANAYRHAALVDGGDPGTVRAAATRALELEPDCNERAALQLVLADAAYLAGRIAESLALSESALAAARDEDEAVVALASRTSALLFLGRAEECQQSAKEASDRAAAVRSPTLRCTTFARMATALASTNDVPAAVRCLELASLDYTPVLPRELALLASARAQIAVAEGNFQDELRWSREASAHFAALGDARRAAGVEVNLASLLNRAGEYAGAEAALRTAIERCQQVGARRYEGYARASLARSLGAQSRPEQALAESFRARQISTETGDARLDVIGIDAEARARSQTVRRDGADDAKLIELLDMAIERARSLKMRPMLSSILRQRALLHAESGDLERAHVMIGEALTLGVGGEQIEIDALELLGAAARIARRRGDPVQTQRYIDDAYARLQAASIALDPELRASFERRVDALFDAHQFAGA